MFYNLFYGRFFSDEFLLLSTFIQNEKTNVKILGNNGFGRVRRHFFPK